MLHNALVVRDTDGFDKKRTNAVDDVLKIKGHAERFNPEIESLLTVSGRRDRLQNWMVRPRETTPEPTD